MNSDIIILALAVLPVIVLAIFVYKKDQYNKEPFLLLCKAFFFGVLSVIPASLIESVVSPLYSIMGGTDLPVFFQGIFTGFVVAGCTEEICKLIFLKWAVWKSPHFDEYFDGIVYATFVSLGFAGIENIMYVVSQQLRRILGHRLHACHPFGARAFLVRRGYGLLFRLGAFQS